MIAVDTSALVAIALNEPAASRCRTVLETEADLLIAAPTVAETLIVADRRGFGAEMRALIDNFGFTVVSFTEADAKKVAQAYGMWGKGMHPAGLNFGDCFSYVIARAHECPLLFVGDDFSQTDIQAAFPAPSE